MEVTEQTAVESRKIQFWTSADIEAETPKQIDWVVRPWVAGGAITEIDGKPKVAGKTTFLLHVVSAVLDGRPFMGEPTVKSPVVYLTEQSMGTFRVPLQAAGLLGRQDLHVLFWNETLGVAWPEIVKAARAECKRTGAKLLCVDTLPQFAGMVGEDENNARDALKAMRPLQKAAHFQCLALVIARHERKSGGEVGDSARGSSAFAGAVDEILSIRRPEGNTRPTLREIHALSRFGETPAKLTIELTEHGYVSHGDVSSVAAHEAKAAILAAAPKRQKQALTRQELLKNASLPDTTGRRAIEELLEQKRLARCGKGMKGAPYLYWAQQESDQ